MNHAYGFLKDLTEEQFVALVVATIAAAKDNFDSVDPAEEAAVNALNFVMETVSHQIAVFFAQRYDESVPTEEPMGWIDFSQDEHSIEGDVKDYVAHYASL